MCTLNTHSLVLKRKRTESPIFIVCKGSLLSLKSRLLSSFFVFAHAPCFLKDEGMSSVSLYENRGAPLQMFCRPHPVHRWDPSNQLSQLPLKSHHFPSSQIDLCLIDLKVRQSGFILTHQNLRCGKVFDFLLPKLGSRN